MLANSEEFRVKMELVSMVILALQKDKEWALPEVKEMLETSLEKLIASLMTSTFNTFPLPSEDIYFNGEDPTQTSIIKDINSKKHTDDDQQL